MRITRALAKLRADLPTFRRKPTKKDLARLAGVHVNTLDLRSKSQTKDLIAGWPLSDLADLQEQWRKIAQGALGKGREASSSPAPASVDRSFDLEAYKRQNIGLIYRNEELAQENLGLQRVVDNLRRELDIISGENSKLKAAHLALKRDRARLKSVK